MNSVILRIACADQTGIVAKVTGALYRRNLNVISNAEHVDREASRFFMRTEFEGEADLGELRAEITGLLTSEAEVEISTNPRKRIVVLASREAHCLGDLLVRCAFSDLHAEILAVAANHRRLEDLSTQFGHPFHFVPHEDLSREDHEEQMMKVIDQYQPDYVVLAKYMRILSPGFVSRYPGRIINIHHSFLPAFIGASPYRQAYERGVKIIGATAHYVTNELDEGPIIAQGVIPVAHSHSIPEMIREGRDVEKTVLARALRLVFNERVFVHGRRTVIFD